MFVDSVVVLDGVRVVDPPVVAFVGKGLILVNAVVVFEVALVVEAIEVALVGRGDVIPSVVVVFVGVIVDDALVSLYFQLLIGSEAAIAVKKVTKNADKNTVR